MKIADEFSAIKVDSEIAALRDVLLRLEQIEDAMRHLNVMPDFADPRWIIMSEIDEREDALAEWNRSETETTP